MYRRVRYARTLVLVFFDVDVDDLRHEFAAAVRGRLARVRGPVDLASRAARHQALAVTAHVQRLYVDEPLVRRDRDHGGGDHQHAR